VVREVQERTASDWQRIEAVRNALFTTAKNRDNDPRRLGNGILQALDALDVKPVLGLKQTEADNDSFAFLRVLTGLGIESPPPREQMYNLEIAQRWMLNPGAAGNCSRPGCNGAAR